jgi:hypothetical protein
MNFKYLISISAIIAFATYVISLITNNSPWMLFTSIAIGCLLSLFFYHFFIYCTCRIVNKFLIFPDKNDKD